MKKKEFLKDFKLWKFYKLCEDDLFGKFLMKYYVQDNLYGFSNSALIKKRLDKKTNLNIVSYRQFIGDDKPYKIKFKNFILWNKAAPLLQQFYKQKTLKKKLRRDFKINLSYLWLLSIVEKFKRKKRKKLSQIYSIYGKKFRRYYNNISIKKIKMLGVKSQKDFVNCFQTFIFNLETRLDLIIYRLHFFSNLKNCKLFIKGCNLHVDNKLVNQNSIILKKYKVLSIKFDLRHIILLKIFAKLNKHLLFYNYPCYLEVNWRTLMCVIVKPAKKFSEKIIPYYNKLYPNLVYNYYLL